MVLKKFSYGEDKLTFELSMEILSGSLDCHIGEDALKKINNSRKNIESILKSGDKIYGVNTGIGTLCSTIISNEDSSLLQENLLKSHAVGVGKNIPLEILGLGTKRSIGRNFQFEKTLDLSNYSGIIDYSPEELYIKVKSGTPIKQIREELEKNNQYLFR